MIHILIHDIQGANWYGLLPCFSWASYHKVIINININNMIQIINICFYVLQMEELNRTNKIQN